KAIDSPSMTLQCKNLFFILLLASNLRISEKQQSMLAESGHMWGTMRLKRWTVYFFSDERLSTKTWKQFFLSQVKQGHRVALAQPEDFTCKEVSENLGLLRAITYLSGGDLSMDRQESAQSFVMSLKCRLFTWDVQEGAVIWEGNIYTPDLRHISRVNASGSVALLLCSPNEKEVFQQHVFPMVFFTGCLLKSSEGDTLLSLLIPFDVCWASRKTSRKTVMFQKGSHKKTKITTFDFTTEWSDSKTVTQAQKVASFLLPFHMKAPNYLGINDRNMIVFESGPHLFLFTIDGLPLRRFEDNQRPSATYQWVPVHVLTTSTDNSLRVYMW
uniref:F-box and WD repeat domain containing 12 n=1 Tax=Loxodonta africana TaxID=9785 RepID=G3UE89_LOXAF